MNFIPEFFKIVQILMIDISMTADNAIAVGLVVAGLSHRDRIRATTVGLIIATSLRVIFSLFAVQLLKIAGLLVAGGFLLLWVCWKLFLEIRASKQKSEAQDFKLKKPIKTFYQAIVQIALADISMSLDNVLAVAGVSRNNTTLMVVGLVLSVALMGLAANLMAKFMNRFSWLAYVGIASVLYSSLSMIYEGWGSL